MNLSVSAFITLLAVLGLQARKKPEPRGLPEVYELLVGDNPF